jgi:hypothetical protein
MDDHPNSDTVVSIKRLNQTYRLLFSELPYICLAMSASHSEFILHIWPGKWNLQSIDPHCLAAALYLQLSIPGKYSIIESVNPDLSPSGKYLSALHGKHRTSQV